MRNTAVRVYSPQRLFGVRFKQTARTNRATRWPVWRLVAKKDGDLARQMKRAAASVPSNVAEGNGRTGKDRRYHFTVAAGSARELDCQVRLAIAWGHVAERRCEAALALLDRQHALLWRLTH